jgi:hypothetical protein
MSGVSCTHHILGIEHLLVEFRDSEGSILLGSTGCEGSKSNHEEVETWEGNEVDGQLSKIRVQLTRETETACYS